MANRSETKSMSLIEERHGAMANKSVGFREPRSVRRPATSLSVSNRVALKNRSNVALTFPMSSPSASTVSPVRRTSRLTYLLVKRAMDICFSIGGIVLLAPVMVCVALCIFGEDRGSVLYCQTRVGRDGRLFRFYKFRSMVRNADEIKKQLMAQNEASGPIFKMKNDPRITRIGRFIRRYSLDELPQLWNVLRGDMSLVGPRPHLPVEVANYKEHQKARLTVQPPDCFACARFKAAPI